MLTRIRITDKAGYPIFRVADNAPIIESGDTIRLQNYALSIFNNLRWAFKCHEEATDAVRRHKPGAKGMDFGTFAGKILCAGAHTKQSDLDKFKDQISALLDKLDKNDETVKKLKEMCYVEHDPEILYQRQFLAGS